MSRSIKAYLGLAVLILCFAGIGARLMPPGVVFPLDFQLVVGTFGDLTVSDENQVREVLLKNGEGAKAGFIYCIGLIPSVMMACGVLAVLQFWETDIAAQRVFSLPVRILTGLPGNCAVAMFVSLQSSDAGALMTKELHGNGTVTDQERKILAMWQFSSSGTLINVYSSGLALLPIIVMPVGNILLVIIASKFLGANLMRLFLCWFEKEEARG